MSQWSPIVSQSDDLSEDMYEDEDSDIEYEPNYEEIQEIMQVTIEEVGLDPHAWGHPRQSVLDEDVSLRGREMDDRMEVDPLQSPSPMRPPPPPSPPTGCGGGHLGSSRSSMSGTARGSSMSRRLGQREIDESNGWTYEPRNHPPEQSFESKSGVRTLIDENSTPYECLTKFLSKDFWELVKTETNRYAAQLNLKLAKKGLMKDNLLLSRWKPVTLMELKQFFSIVIHMTLVRKESIDTYWSMKPILYSSFATTTLGRDRFRAIYSCLHLNDNTKYIARGKENYDAFFKLRPYFDELCRLFQAHYMPDESLTIYEGTCGLRGRVHFGFFNKDKPEKYGKKIYMLCDAKTGYILTMMPCVGASKSTSEIVMELMEPYLWKWQTVYMDQYFTSPAIFKQLWEHNTRAVGTVMLNQQGLPQEWRHQPLVMNEMVFCHRENLTACKWKDKREVSFLSTKHGATWTEVEVKTKSGIIKRIKPDGILDYNINKVSVDLNDQCVAYYSFRRKSMKWWKKMFFHLVARSMVNAYIIYNKSRLTQKRMGFAKFLSDCGEAMVEDAGIEDSPQSTSGRHSALGSKARLTARHFMDRIPPSDKKQTRTRVCKVCADTEKKRTGKRGRKETSYWCPDCEIPLCAHVCFKKYHTQKDYTA